MKKITLFLFLFIVCTSLFSAPLENEPITVTQPDGVVLNIFASGDEYYNWLHDKDNYTIVQDDNTGYYVYANLIDNKITSTNLIVGRVNPAFSGLLPGIKLPPEEILKKRNARFAITPKDAGDAPKTGTINNLIVFIRFSDESEFTDLISYYRGIFNNDTSGKNSMYNYFKNASYNSLFVTSTFYPVPPGTTVISYKDSHPRSYFRPYNATTNPNGYTSSNLTSREHTLLKDAINYVASQVPTTLNLDGDNDGKVDNVCFIVYGSSTAWADLLWPHMWSLFTYTVNINGKRVYDYNFQLQNSLKSSGPGVLCHEMGHSLGAPDLYHYVGNGISPCSTWDVMCSNTNPPQHFGAYMKYKYLTWISSIPIISTTGTYTLKPITSQTNNCYRINSPYTSTEYYVVEFRRKALPFENTIPGSGLLVYRINTTATGNANGPPDEVYIYRPGGTPTINGSPESAHFSNLVSRTKINNTTNPSPFLSNGAQGGLNIYNITSKDTLISFSLGTSSGIQQVNSFANEYKLMQNFPNPFNPSTIIRFQIKESGFVTMKIYDILGKEIAVLVNENLKSGIYEVNWNAENYSSGVYFFKLETNKFSDIKKMAVVK